MRMPIPDRQSEDRERRLIAVIDDDAGTRRATRMLLEGADHRVAAFADGEDFLAFAPPVALGCALLELRMPGLSGLDVLRSLAEQRDPPPVMVLSGQADIATAVAAMKLGAADFLAKPYRPEILLERLAEILALGGATRQSRAKLSEARALVDHLPRRHQEVLAGIARGHPNKIIAWELGLSTRTVEAYRAQLLTRLGVRSTAEAIRIALSAEVCA